jgi:putative transposase
MKREVNHWSVIFSCEVADPEPLPLSYEDVGIDLGVSHLATLSNGEMIEHPRCLRVGEHKLKAAQQALARKKRRSHRREKAKRVVGKAHRKLRNQRRDFLHKASRNLIHRYQVLVFENIQMKHLTKKPKAKQDEQTGQYLPNGAAANGGLNKSILDAGWGLFVSMCSAKAEEAGRTLLNVSPRFTSQICSSCGTVRKKDLSERWHRCECGAELDRDVNAAINSLARGKQQLSAGTRPSPETA